MCCAMPGPALPLSEDTAMHCGGAALTPRDLSQGLSTCVVKKQLCTDAIALNLNGWKSHG